MRCGRKTRSIAACTASSREFVPMSSKVYLSCEPWKRSIRTRSATASSRHVTSPPSPRANRFFVGKKLNVEQTPVCAMPSAPNACAASSISGRPERGELRERRRPAEEVDGHDRLRTRRDSRGDVLGVEVQGHRVDVGEDRRRTDTRDRLGRRVEREGRADHLVAATDAEGFEREDERVGSVRYADRMRHAEEGGRLALERLDLGAEDEATGVEDGGEALFELWNERRVLRFDVDERDLVVTGRV